MSWWDTSEDCNDSWHSKQADGSECRGQQKSWSVTDWQGGRGHGQGRRGRKRRGGSKSGAAFPNHDGDWRSGPWGHGSKGWDSSQGGAAWVAVKSTGTAKGTGKGADKCKGRVAAALAALPGPSFPGGAFGMDPGRLAPTTGNLDGSGGMPNIASSSQLAPQTQTQGDFIEQVSKTSIPEGRIYWIRNGKSQWEPPPFEQLVDPWQKHKKKDETIFYYNRVTKETVFEWPPPFQAPGTPPQQQERQTVTEKQSGKEKSKHSIPTSSPTLPLKKERTAAEEKLFADLFTDAESEPEDKKDDKAKKEKKKDRKERKEKGNVTKQKETQTAPKSAEEKKDKRKADVKKAQSDRARTGRNEAKKKETKKAQEDTEEGDPKVAAPVTPSAGSSSGRQQVAPSETPPKWFSKARKRRRLPQVLATSPQAREMESFQLSFSLKLQSGELSRTLDDAKMSYSPSTARHYCRALELLNQEFGGQLLDKVRSSLESPVQLIEEVQKLDHVSHGHVALTLCIDFIRRQPPLTAEEESRKRRILEEREKEMELEAVLSKFEAKLENGEIEGKRVEKYTKSSAKSYSGALRILNQESGESLLSKVWSSLDASEIQEYFASFNPSSQHWARALSMFVDLMKDE